MANLKLFHINTVADWLPVKAHLLRIAVRLTVPSSEIASNSHEEAMERIRRLTPETVRSLEAQAVAILYRQQMLLSLIMTIEPDQKPHISLTRLLNGQMIMVNDPLALECAKALLGEYEERIEGGFQNVRNFYGLHQIVN